MSGLADSMTPAGDLRREMPKRVRVVRELREMSQSELARATGLEPSAIAHIEAGRRLPSSETLRALCKGLMVSADFLLGLSSRVSP